MKVDILGAKWTITLTDKTKDVGLLDSDGYCDPSSRLIVVNNAPDESLSNRQDWVKRNLRHEIIHAFLFESGIGFNFSGECIGHSETMIDWMVIQFPKMLKVFKEVKCL